MLSVCLSLWVCKLWVFGLSLSDSLHVWKCECLSYELSMELWLVGRLQCRLAGRLPSAAEIKKPATEIKNQMSSCLKWYKFLKYWVIKNNVDVELLHDITWSLDNLDLAHLSQKVYLPWNRKKYFWYSTIWKKDKTKTETIHLPEIGLDRYFIWF